MTGGGGTGESFDYDKVVFSYFDPEERLERLRTVFPEDCRKAFELGAGLAETAAAETS